MVKDSSQSEWLYIIKSVRINLKRFVSDKTVNLTPTTITRKFLRADNM